jgi:DNA-binding helix-hairpin-helix protein with protein kinase domain
MSVFVELPSSVVDSEGREFALREELSSGGQGAVFRTQFSTDLVKVLFEGNDARETIAHVRRMPLAGLSLARPMSLLESTSGYTLQFQRDMDVVRSLKYAHIQSTRDWWVNSGGMKRRLWMAVRIASIFEQIHARGLVYGDVSSRNIMASTDSSFDEVALIDLDNLSYVGEMEKSHLWTPQYSAPEVAQAGEAFSFSSDSFSLAIVLFELLTSVHPFMDGMKVKQAGTESPYYRTAEQNDVSSVLDKNSDNAVISVPVQSFQDLIEPNLLEAFRRTFEEGRRSKTMRVTAGQLRLFLVRAALAVIDCEKCDWSYSRVIHQRCPDCDNRGTPLKLLLECSGVSSSGFEIWTNTREKSIDLALLFPKLLKLEPVRGSYTIKVLEIGNRIRVLPINQNLIEVARSVEEMEVAQIKGLGEIALRVSRT